MDRIDTCRTCVHLLKMSSGRPHAMYCDTHQSRRTSTGYLRVKCNQPSCDRYRYTSCGPGYREVDDSQLTIFDAIEASGQ